MRSVTYKNSIELQEQDGLLFSNREAYKAQEVIFCTKYKEIIALKAMGLQNIVCIKNNPVRLARFIHFRESIADQVLIYIRSVKAKDLLANLCRKPYYTITYVTDSLPSNIKATVESRIKNIKHDLENKALREELKQQEDDDEDLDAFE